MGVDVLIIRGDRVTDGLKASDFKRFLLALFGFYTTALFVALVAELVIAFDRKTRFAPSRLDCSLGSDQRGR